MRIRFSSLMVGDQDRALVFYTEILGMRKKGDVRNGPYRWLTVVSPDDPEGPELVLELASFPPAATFQKARFEAGMPATILVTGDIRADFERLRSMGVRFRGEPVDIGPSITVLFEDGEGNIVNLAQLKRP
jgi:catechol 2,3-dioxygenase-like lactoylglutathione lyase family enzyme